MNLYRIIFSHTAPKDTEYGTVCFLLAGSEDAVYEWLKSEPKITLPDDKPGKWSTIYNDWSDKETDPEYAENDIYDDKYELIGTETFKEKMMRLKGEVFDDDVDFGDAYYGITLHGWQVVKDGLTDVEVQTLIDLGIAYRTDETVQE